MRAILFDLNGVLVDDEPIHCELVCDILAEEGVRIGEEDYWSRYLGLDDRACFAAALADAGSAAPEALVARLVARKAAYYQMRVRRDGFPVFPGARELVIAAHDAGWRLGIVSGALRAEVEGALEQMDLEDRFLTLVTSDDVENGKPDPEGYRRGLQELNARPPLPERLLHPHEVLAIEDSPAGLRAAAAVGLATLGVAHTHPVERLADIADRVVPSIAETTLATLARLFPES